MAAPCEWGRNGVHPVGFVHFQAMRRFVFYFFNAFVVLLWTKTEMLNKGAIRGCKSAQSEENPLSAPSCHSDNPMSSGNYSL